MCAHLKIAREFTWANRSDSAKKHKLWRDLHVSVTLTVFRGTFKWHWKHCGWHLEAGIRLQTPEASTGVSANGDHTHISLYNLSHYTWNLKYVGFTLASRKERRRDLRCVQWTLWLIKLHFLHLFTLQRGINEPFRTVSWRLIGHRSFFGPTFNTFLLWVFRMIQVSKAAARFAL